MKITNIKPQVKRADRYSIYADCKYVFSLSEGQLIKLGLRLGQELSDDDLAGLKEQALVGKAYERALNLIMHRPRSEWEIATYLSRKGYDAPVAEQISDKLRARGYLDDLEFARRWVDNRRLLKSTSRRRLSQELRQKRVGDDVINQVLAADQTDEQQVLTELIQRKRGQTKYQNDIKLMQYLSRQGFNYDDIKSAITGD